MPAGLQRRHDGHRLVRAYDGHVPAIGGSASVGRKVELFALVTNLGRNLVQLGRVGLSVVAAEHQIASTEKDDVDIGLGAASVATICDS